MVLLEFRRDAAELRDLRTDPVTADAGDIELILMRQPIHLVVGDVTVLDFTLVPLYYMAGFGLHVVRNLPKKTRGELEIPEGSLKLTFQLRGDVVSVREEYYGRDGRDKYEELLNAWERFSEEARDFLLSEFPGLAEHPQVGGWFRNEEGWQPPWWDSY